MPSSYYEKVGNAEPVCVEDEMPFELPSGWVWSRLSACCRKEIRRGKSPKYAPAGETLVFAQKCNTKSGGINLGLAKFLDEGAAGRYPQSEFLQDFDIVINSTGTGTLGRVGIYRDADNADELPVVPDSHVTTIRISRLLDAAYIYVYLKHSQAHLESMGEGSTNQKELKPYVLAEMLVPVPPAEEQKRISFVVQHVLNKFDELE